MALDVHKLDQRYTALKTERSGWDETWQELSELFLPTRWRGDTDESAHKQPKTNTRLVNSTGVLAIRTLASGLHGGMTSPVRPWFRLQIAGDIGQAGATGANAWLDEVTQRMQFLLHQSNFYEAIHGLYSDLGTFGTALLVENGDADGLRFDLVRAGEYVLDVDDKGRVDTFFRRMHMTARQILEKWPDSSPDMVRTAAKHGEVRRFNIIHGVFPRTELAFGSLDKEGMPYVSVYWVRDGAGGRQSAILDEGGYKMFPAFAPRWDITGFDVYGRSPAMDVMPDVKMLQAMTTSLRKMQHKIADPPMLGDSSLKRYGVDRNPGGFTYGDFQMTGGKPLVIPIQQPESAALGYTMTAIQGVEEMIKAGLYVDLFRLMMDDDRKGITATEVQARQNEKLILLGPVVERMHDELLGPLIKRTYQLMAEYNYLPPAPEGFGGVELDIRFESVLAQAQKIMTTSAIDQGIAFVAQFAQMKPEVLDIIDGDNTARSYLKRVGVPESCMADEQTIEETRQARAEAEAQAQQQAQAQAMSEQILDVSGAAKNMGQTPVGADGQTLLGSILGGLGG